jgi:two-component system OmpR family sensor kinase
MRKLWPIVYPIFLMIVVLIFAVLLWRSILPDLILVLRIDLGNLVFIGGAVTVAAWIALILIWNRELTRSINRVQYEAADEKRRFLRRLDHELKNPIMAIRAGLANLEGVSTGEVQKQALSSVEAQTLRLSRLSSDLRKLSELEMRPLEKTAVDINEMLNEAFNLAKDQPNAIERELKLTIPRAPWPLPVIQGDRDLLFLVVHNLLDNAIKYTLPGNQIEVRAFEDGSTLVMEVADTGQGIPEDELCHIGEELYRGRGARGIPGNGLGLALVRSIIQRHGGQTIIRSRAAQGTVVTLRLPVHSQNKYTS